MYEVGAEKGKYYSLNVPLKDGIDDQSESCDCHVIYATVMWPNMYSCRLCESLQAYYPVISWSLQTNMHCAAGKDSTHMTTHMTTEFTFHYLINGLDLYIQPLYIVQLYMYDL